MPKVVHTNTKGLIQQSGEGVDLQAGLAIGVQSVAAAGDSQATATAVSASGGALVLVSASDNTKGVRLPALSSVATGQLFMIQNTISNKMLKVYPATGDKFLTVNDNVHIEVAASTLLICVKADGDKWVGCETLAMTGA